MPTHDLSDALQRYLQESRDGMLASLHGLSEYDVRRPMTPTGTNLLGLVKHLAGVEIGYLGDSVGRPSPVSLPWVDDDSVWDGADMWAKADESREYVVDLYHQAWQHTDESIAQLPLDAPASVSWWPEERRETTFGSLLVRVVAETGRHAGHADILRETIDGQAGSDHDDVGDDAWWAAHLARIQESADAHRT
ncbi:DinB family protein [Aeromicrobium sp.]|uniref:DinB family protein n=1 Tax=Aeromicrobium sp. TaxID=1871063 RepID=UPI003C32B73A